MKKSKILLVEDNPQNKYLATFLLEDRGHFVISASDGIRAIELAKLELPNLILMDIQLPLIDGYETAKQIKSTRELSQIPIVAITSYAMTGDREKAQRAGCVGYIEKPINSESFVSEIESFLF